MVGKACPLSVAASWILVGLGYALSCGMAAALGSQTLTTKPSQVSSKQICTSGLHLHNGENVNTLRELLRTSKPIRNVHQFPQIIKWVGNYHSWVAERISIQWWLTTSKGGSSQWVIMNDISPSIYTPLVLFTPIMQKQSKRLMEKTFFLPHSRMMFQLRPKTTSCLVFVFCCCFFISLTLHLSIYGRKHLVSTVFPF